MYASNPWPLESMLLSMLLEHQKALSALEERLQRLEQQDYEGRAGGFFVSAVPRPPLKLPSHPPVRGTCMPEPYGCRLRLAPT